MIKKKQKEGTDTDRLIFHVDVNSAFLSWEAMRRVKRGEADLRLVPSCIGGDPSSRRSIVVAKSIPAKKYGVTTGEPVSAAMRKCPGLIVVPSDFRLYAQCSAAFKDICRLYAPAVEEFSIDECFLDMTGTGRIYPDPIATAHEIKDRIREELGFTVNVGVGRSKLCAKMASDFEKPDRVHTLFPEEIREKMWPLPVGDLLFVGKAAVRKLDAARIRTIGEMAQADPELLARLLGEKMSVQARNYANGIDDSPVLSEPEAPKGYSNEITLEDNVTAWEAAETILAALSDSVAQRMREDGVRAYSISVTIRYPDFRTRSHQCTLKEAVDTNRAVFETSKRLLEEIWKDRQPLRLMGVAATKLTREAGAQQMSFLDDPNREKRERDEKLDRAMDTLKKRFGQDVIRRGSVMSMGIDVARKHRGEAEKNERDD
ncbi:MAG: DNA polymerase IV [Clostridia bacterium]|nr:DNA polymerase IV [Clostridia bacterium]